MQIFLYVLICLESFLKSFFEKKLKGLPGNAFSSNSKGPRASLVAQLVKNLHALRDTWVQTLGGGAPEKGALPSPAFLPGEFLHSHLRRLRAGQASSLRAPRKPRSLFYP